jgi:ParB family transcriptional regulator, chromosome partitioning protein
MTTIQTIPLDKLVASPSNVRKTNVKERLDELVASIEANGLINNLFVKPKGDGTFEVVAGERRRKAMLILMKEKKLPADHPVLCAIADEAADIMEISTAENLVREKMHPADEFVAFKAMIDRGSTAADTAAHFGVAEKVVLQRLKLASVSPKLFNLFREGKMNLGQLMAFTIIDDHARQEKVWKDLPGYERERGSSGRMIRSQLTEQHISADNRLAKFVTIKAYEGAGGTVLKDFFDAENEGWITDPDLLNRLAMEKLVKAQAKCIEAGWKWAEVMPDIDYSGLQKFEPLPVPRRLNKDGDAKFTREEMSKSGCIITVSSDGKVEIHAGRLTPEDAKAEHKAAKAKAKGKPAKKGDKATNETGISAKLVESLTAHRSAALAATLAGKPHVALAAVVHALALSTLYEYPQTDCCLSISATMTYYGGSAPEIEEGPAEKIQADATKGATKGMPKNPEALWNWLLGQSDKELIAILAVCAACTVDAIQKRGAEKDGHSDQLAAALKLDMTDFWKPTVAAYFDQVSAKQIIEAVTEGGGKTAAHEISSMHGAIKKAELAKLAEKLLKDKNWLPEILRGGK